MTTNQKGRQATEYRECELAFSKAIISILPCLVNFSEKAPTFPILVFFQSTLDDMENVVTEVSHHLGLENAKREFSKDQFRSERRSENDRKSSNPLEDGENNQYWQEDEKGEENDEDELKNRPYPSQHTAEV